MKGLVPLYANDGNVASIGRKTFVLSDFGKKYEKIRKMQII